MSSKFKKTNFKNAVRRNVEKRAKENSGFGYLNLPKGLEVLKEREGKMYLDFLPYIIKTDKHPDLDIRNEVAEAGSLWYKFPFMVHKSVGANNDSVVCPRTFGKKCPICEYREKRAQAGAEWEEIKIYKASKRNLYAVVPIGEKKVEEVVHIWDVSDYLFQQLLDEELQNNEDWANFPALEGGRTLVIRFEEKKWNKATYYEAKRIDFEEREDYGEDILDEVPCLEELLDLKSYEEIQSLFLEIDQEDINDEDKETETEEKPTRSLRKRKKVEEAEEEEEVEEEEEEVEEEEEEVEEEKPKRAIRKPKQEVKEEEEEEEKKLKKEVKKKETKKTEGKECPHGHKWGEADEHKECNSCEVWDDCIDG